jgi:hypothetical protein
MQTWHCLLHFCRELQLGRSARVRMDVHDSTNANSIHPTVIFFVAEVDQQIPRCPRKDLFVALVQSFAPSRESRRVDGQTSRNVIDVGIHFEEGEKL